jgi:hypothetical protein
MRIVFDRLFGLVAAAAFALGIIGQVELLSRVNQANPFEPLLVTFFALAVVAIGYITLLAERKYGLIDPYDESVNLVEVAFSLPLWTIIVSMMLVGYVVLLVIGVRDANLDGDLLAQLPSELSVLRYSLSANGVLAVVVAALTVQSFVIASFFLIRKPIGEFR